MNEHVISSFCWCKPGLYVFCDQECCEFVTHVGCHVCHGTGYKKYEKDHFPVIVVHNTEKSMEGLVHFLEDLTELEEIEQ